MPKVLEAEVEVEKQQEGVGQGEQGKLLLEVRIALIDQPKSMQFYGCYAWCPNMLKWTRWCPIYNPKSLKIILSV